MSALKAYATHIASAMDILAEAHGMSECALLDLGLPDVEAHDLRALAAVYFGPTGFSRKQRHAAAAARHHDLGVARGDLLRRQGHRPEARAAELVDSEGRSLHRDAGRHRRLPRRVLVVGGGYIACEFATILTGLGCETVQVYRGDAVLRGAGGQVVRFDDQATLTYGKPGFENPFFIAYAPGVLLHPQG